MLFVYYFSILVARDGDAPGADVLPNTATLMNSLLSDYTDDGTGILQDLHDDVRAMRG